MGSAAAQETSSTSHSLVGRLSRATFNYGLGQLLPQIIGFALIPLYTAYLSPRDFGVLDIATSFSAFLLIAMRLGVPGAVTRFFYEHKDPDSLRDYVTTVSWFVLCASFVVGALVLAVSPFVTSHWLRGLDVFPYVVLAIIGAVMSGNSDVQRRLIQAREQSLYSVKLNLATSSVTILLAIVFVAGLQWGAWGMLLAYTITSCIFFAQAIAYLRPDLKGRFRSELLVTSLRYAVAILPSHVVGALAPLATRAILAAYGTMSSVGLLSIANRFASPLTILATAFNTAYLPIYFSVRTDAKPEQLEQLADTARKLITVAMLFSLSVALLGPPAIRIMTPSTYHAAAPIVPVFTIGFLAQITFAIFGSEIYYSKRTWLVPVVAAASATVTVTLTAALAPRWGEVGVAWAMNLGVVASAAAAVLVSWRSVPVKHDWRRVLASTGVAAIAFTVSQIHRPASPWAEAALGALLLAGTIAVLWVVGDPMLRGGLRGLRKVLRR